MSNQPSTERGARADTAAMTVTGELTVRSRSAPLGRTTLWIAETGLQDACAPTVFEAMWEDLAFRPIGKLWIVDVDFERPELSPGDVHTLYARIERDPGSGLSVGDWFTRAAPTFEGQLPRSVRLTLQSV